MNGKPLVVAITGASGAIYGRGVVEAALATGRRVELVASAPARRVARGELEADWTREALDEWLGARAANVRLHAPDDIGAAIASGSFPTQAMIVAPCSAGTAGRIAGGLSETLIERAADVHLKERRPLVLVVRETPLSAIHLENLLRLARAGATVLPASPGFYARPKGIDDLVRFVVERALAAAGIEAPRSIEWHGDSPP